MQDTSTPTLRQGSRSRAMFLIAILAALGAGLIIGHLSGQGLDEMCVPETVHAVEVGSAPQMGPANAPVTVVLFTDFRCPHCRKASSMMEKLRERYGDEVRIVFKHKPMPFHPDAFLAHEAAAAAHKQGKFWAFHDLVFAHEGPLGRPDLERMATEIGLDMTAFGSDLDRGAFKTTVEADIRQADGLGVTGTPTLFINGRKVVGANWKLIQRVASYEKRRTSQLLEAGVPLEAIYKEVLRSGLGNQAQAAPPPAPQPPRPVEDANTVYRVELGNSTLIGKPDAPVTVVMFIDYQCPFSQKATETMARLMQSHGDSIRLVLKNNPQPRHPGAMLAAEAALAAGNQGKFKNMHDLLFENRSAQSRQDLEKYAKLAGLDMKAFREALDKHSMAPLIDQEQKMAAMLGARSTPTYFINGRKLEGNQPYEVLDEAVKKSLAQAQKLIDSGVAPADLYETIIATGSTGAVYSKTPDTGGAADPNMPF